MQGKGNNPRGRGRGRGHTSQPKDKNVIIQHGKQKLIAQKLTHIPENEASLYEEFKRQYLATQHQKEGETSSYAQVLSEEDPKPSYYTHQHKEIIFLLEPKDLQWKDNPWLLMNRYLDTDISMAGSSNEDCLAGESQDPDDDMLEEDLDEDKIDHMVNEIEDAARQAIK
ncbi:hypothetical protein M9H77_16829 [Catharanthus roseus]|uniref:Uncharacterized protein n=1 Tax=Catharanthus roseus TaxID=4058 RepID=A0ACC0B2U1_CATRO|nr:hypothetical protein M9H77_16829 [Catharanthus roseus]